MHILFCDDNHLVVEQLYALVAEFFSNLGGFEPKYTFCNNGDALLENKINVDIAFLDVEMPGVSGIHVGAKLKEYNPFVKIFIVTSFPDYLDEAMRYQVFRYLSKPIDKNRLFRNLKDAVYLYNIETKKYSIQTYNGISVRRSEEIVCVEASQKKVFIYTIDEILISTQNMDYWQRTLLLPCFYISHRSFIVNMRFVNTISKDKILLKYSGRTKEAYLTRKKYTDFKNTYLMYQESIR